MFLRLSGIFIMLLSLFVVFKFLIFSNDSDKHKIFWGSHESNKDDNSANK